jgi:hypothetical protein
LPESACSSGSFRAVISLEIGKHILQYFAFQNTIARSALNVAICVCLQADDGVGKSVSLEQREARVFGR